MIGSFGEVQVVDWGFAKVLRKGGIADERLAKQAARMSTIINTANAALADRGRTGKFTRPLIPQGADSKPQLVTGEDYNSRKKSQQGDPWVAVKRGINFGMAEFFSQEERTED